MLLQSLILGLSLVSSLQAEKISHTVTQNSPKETVIKATLALDPQDAIYKEYISLQTDHPNVTIKEWKTDQVSQKIYDEQLGKDVAVLTSPVKLSITATKQSGTNPDAHIYLTYITRKNSSPREHIIPISFSQAVTTNKNLIPTEPAQNDLQPEGQSWYEYIESLIEQTQSTWIRALLAFLLGLLMSLTPCIYPMIPITVGILQAQGKKSVIYNFMISLAYTCGIATTFALCGVTAALTGAVCGNLVASPLFVFLMIGVLLYFAFSMFGFYEMHVPRFLQKQIAVKGGSVLSIFAFGMISGTVASPCLTPGLALLLTIVGTLGSYMLGFILLFAFGIGLSVPLLLIGTFSGSLSMLPKAGMWMVEVKKVFGFMLIGMTFYFLNNITPWWLMLWLMGATTFISGLYYLYDVQKTNGRFAKAIKNIIGMAAITGSILIFANAYQETFFATPITCKYENWETDYQNALACAKSGNKKVFIDFWATFCSICKAIDRKVLSSDEVQESLKQFVALKVDGTNPSSEPFATLQARYKIKGFPTFLLIDPDTGEIIKQWGSEIYQGNKQFLQDLNQYA